MTAKWFIWVLLLTMILSPCLVDAETWQVCAQHRSKQGNRTWLLSDEGGSRELALGWKNASGAVGNGANNPILDPTGHLLAYGIQDTLFLYDVSVDRRRAASVAPTGHYILITAWSPDGSELLFFIKPNHYGCCTAPPENWKPQPGFHRLDIKSLKVTALATLDEKHLIFGWLSADKLLAATAYYYLPSEIGLYSLSSQRYEEIQLSQSVSQLSRMREREVLARRGNGDMGSKSELIRIHLRTGNETSIPGTRVSGIGYQFPRASPDGKWVAYTGKAEGKSVLLINQRPVFTATGSHIHHKWISDKALCAASVDSVVTILVPQSPDILSRIMYGGFWQAGHQDFRLICHTASQTTGE